MAVCRCGDISQDCSEGCGCGCVCDVGVPDRCWFLCSCPGQDPIIHGPEVVSVTTRGNPRPFSISAEITLCARGIRMEQLAELLDRATTADIQIQIPVSALKKKVTLKTTGPLGTVLTRLGLESRSRRARARPAS